ncbi:MAG: OmpA family protein [Variovorax sp.]
MTHKMIQRTGMALGVVALLALQACGTSMVSKGISDEGVASEVVFPAQKDAWFKEGTFPNLDNLRRIAPGVTKDQLYDFVGRPHFREGLGAVREWDYIFHFRTPTGIKTCQYKAIFDKNVVAQSFHWLPTDCADMLKVAAAPMPPAPVPVPALVPVPPKKLSFAADGLFRFDGGQSPDLLPEGKRRIQQLAAELRRGGAQHLSITIVGHTDRLGSAAYNDRLSLARANTVRDILVKEGIAPASIRASGAGELKPVVMCSGNVATPELLRCLQPNRRVDIDVRTEP